MSYKSLTTNPIFSTILRPYMESNFSKHTSAISLSAFPRDSNQYTVIFGSNRASTISKRSSKRDSISSFYDNNPREGSYDDVYSGTAGHGSGQRPGFPRAYRSVTALPSLAGSTSFGTTLPNTRMY